MPHMQATGRCKPLVPHSVTAAHAIQTGVWSQIRRPFEILSTWVGLNVFGQASLCMGNTVLATAISGQHKEVLWQQNCTVWC